MNKWCKIDSESVVREIIVFKDDVTPSMELPNGWQWIQKTNAIKNNPCIEGTYDSERNAFIGKKNFESWILDEETCKWKAPVDVPEEQGNWVWDEEQQLWIDFPLE